MNSGPVTVRLEVSEPAPEPAPEAPQESSHLSEPFSSILEEIANERDDVRVVKLNTDDNQQTAVQYQVLAIPTMILFRNGQEVKRIQGAMPKKRIEAELAPALAA